MNIRYGFTAVVLKSAAREDYSRKGVTNRVRNRASLAPVTLFSEINIVSSGYTHYGTY